MEVSLKRITKLTQLLLATGQKSEPGHSPVHFAPLGSWEARLIKARRHRQEKERSARGKAEKKLALAAKELEVLPESNGLERRSSGFEGL